MTNEPRSDGLQLAHEREQRRRSETLNPGPARGQDTAECIDSTRERWTHMHQMAEHPRRKPGARRPQQWHTTAATGGRNAPRQPPQLHQTPHQRRRQRDRREEQQVTEAAHKEQHRRLHRQAKAHLDGLPKAWPPTLTERLKRPPARTGIKRPTKLRKVPKSLEKASDQSNTGGSWQQTAGGRGFAGAQNPGKSR